LCLRLIGQGFGGWLRDLRRGAGTEIGRLADELERTQGGGVDTQGAELVTMNAIERGAAAFHGEIGDLVRTGIGEVVACGEIAHGLHGVYKRRSART
jgi:hypothetical protein